MISRYSQSRATAAPLCTAALAVSLSLAEFKRISCNGELLVPAISCTFGEISRGAAVRV
jgi:hypothetical protein